MRDKCLRIIQSWKPATKLWESLIASSKAVELDSETESMNSGWFNILDSGSELESSNSVNTALESESRLRPPSKFINLDKPQTKSPSSISQPTNSSYINSYNLIQLNYKPEQAIRWLQPSTTGSFGSISCKVAVVNRSRRSCKPAESLGNQLPLQNEPKWQHQLSIHEQTFERGVLFSRGIQPPSQAVRPIRNGLIADRLD